MGCFESFCSKKKNKEQKINENPNQMNQNEDKENDAVNSLNALNMKNIIYQYSNNLDDNKNNQNRENSRNKNQRTNTEIFHKKNKEMDAHSQEIKKGNNDTILEINSKKSKNNKRNKLIINSNSEKDDVKIKKIKKKKVIKNYEETLQKLKEEINQRKNELEKINNEYKEKKDKLNEIKNNINKHKEEIEKINKKKNEIKKNNEELKLIDDELNFKKKEIRKCDEELEQKKEELNIRKNKLKMIKVELEKNKEELKYKENLIQKKNEELMNREYNLNKREKDLIEREKNLNLNTNKKEPILIGLNNIGATCYMNASLQCLSNTKKLTQYFLKTYKYTSDKIMANEYYKVIKNLWKKENNNKSYSPNSFKEVLSKENPLFAGIAANDSKDLINFLLERFHKELNVINNENNINNNSMINMLDQTNEQLMLKLFLNEFQEKYNSPISNLFYGIIETKSQCQLCNIIKYNFQIYSFIEFPLQQVNYYFFNKGKRPLLTIDGKNPDIDLYECFEYNQKSDLMSGDNQMFCNNCNKLCNSLYSTFLYSGPYYLIINLNRGKGAVYECKVCFPELLNIVNFLTYKDGVTVYELYAVICHLGPSSMSGHFVAYCRNRIDNKWYLYNDSTVTLCSRKNQYNEGMPYILFYKALMPGQDSEY